MDPRTWKEDKTFAPNSKSIFDGQSVLSAKLQSKKFYQPVFKDTLFPTLRRDKNEAGNRIYVNDDHNIRFISATTFLSQLGDPSDDWLQRWADRIGHDEAERISTESSSFGTALHEMVEKYIKEEIELDKIQSEAAEYIENQLEYCTDPSRIEALIKLNRAAGNQLWRYMKSRYKTVLALEEYVFSNGLKLAGTLDCLAIDMEGETTIIDFKNSRKMKQEKYIENYFLQVFIYATALKEMVKTYYKPNVKADLYKKIYKRMVPTRFEIIIFNRADESKYEKPGIQLFAGKLEDIKPAFIKAYSLWKMQNMSTPSFGATS